MYLETQINLLKTLLKVEESRVVFCHNDILLANVIWNEDLQTVQFIDYEYGKPNYQPFDIANHFDEFAGVDPVSLDYASLYPDPAFQKAWIRHYLFHFNDQKCAIKDAEVEKMYNLVNEFSLAPHLFWGLWSLYQDCNSKIDFDFLG